MSVDNYFLYKTDRKCYRINGADNLFRNDVGEVIDASINEFMEEHFIRQNLDAQTEDPDDLNNGTIYKCKEKAEENNKDYFLVSNASKDSYNSFKYDCYIPRKNRNCVNTVKELLDPINNVINDLLGEINKRTFDNIDNKVSSNDLDTIFSDSSQQNCFRYYPGTSIPAQENNHVRDKYNFFAKKNNFVLYKTELTDNKDITQALKTVVTSLSDYQNIYDTSFTDFDRILFDISNAFYNIVCVNPDNKQQLDEAFIKLKEKYQTLFGYLNNISRDISTVQIITKHDTLYLKKIQQDINIEKDKLRNLLGFDGANNGKLSDTKFLKNLKISEISFLFIIIVFAIFIYSKKK